MAEHLNLDWLERLCRREVDAKRRYLAKIAPEGGRRVADTEVTIAQMEALVTLLSEMQKPGGGLFVDLGGGRSLCLLPEHFARWVRDPAAFARWYTSGLVRAEPAARPAPAATPRPLQPEARAS